MPSPIATALTRPAITGWAAADTVLGPVLAATTARGLCCLVFGNNERELVAALREEAGRVMPGGGGDAQVRALLAQLAAALADPSLPLPAPALDLAGTPFQLRVWQALREIPRGETRSYADIARAIGEPGAARAVGTACGRNRIAVLVPCHRVLRGDGAPGGYRWGTARKQQLLALEQR